MRTSTQRGFTVMALKFRDATDKRAAYLDRRADKGGQDWESLAIGYALAHRWNAKKAADFAYWLICGEGRNL